MIGELANNETKDIRDSSHDNFKNIIPKEEMSTAEVNDYWKSEFNNAANAPEKDVADGGNTESFLDDNGRIYRDANRLLPNNEYEVNGYKYKTDADGRIVSAEGKLRIESDYDRDMEQVKSLEGQDYRERDERGHLIGHQFGGSDRLENLVPMDAKLNHYDFYKVESTLADAVKDGADVRLKVEPKYEDNSSRPTKFKVSYSIDGDRETVVFRNEREG